MVDQYRSNHHHRNPITTKIIRLSQWWIGTGQTIKGTVQVKPSRGQYRSNHQGDSTGQNHQGDSTGRTIKGTVQVKTIKGTVQVKTIKGTVRVEPSRGQYGSNHQRDSTGQTIKGAVQVKPSKGQYGSNHQRDSTDMHRMEACLDSAHLAQLEMLERPQTFPMCCA